MPLRQDTFPGPMARHPGGPRPARTLRAVRPVRVTHGLRRRTTVSTEGPWSSECPGASWADTQVVAEGPLIEERDRRAYRAQRHLAAVVRDLAGPRLPARGRDLLRAHCDDPLRAGLVPDR